MVVYADRQQDTNGAHARPTEPRRKPLGSLPEREGLPKKEGAAAMPTGRLAIAIIRITAAAAEHEQHREERQRTEQASREREEKLQRELAEVQRETR